MRVVNVLLVLWLRSAHAGRCAISGISGAKLSYHHRYFGNILEAHYGNSVNIFCSSNDSKNLNITLDGSSSAGQLTVVNKTTIQLSVDPVIGVYQYTCTDVETDSAVKLRVRVLPVITVISPNVRHKWLPYSGTSDYFVPIAEDYEVICYGNPTLTIRTGRDTNIRVNETTIKSRKLRAMEYSRRVYYCANQDRIEASSRNIEVLSDYVPAATNVWCMEYEWQITCSWTVMSMDTTFTVFYTDKDGNLMRIYEDYSGIKKTRRFEWSLKDGWKHTLAISRNLSLVIQACNPIYCSNQTYTVDRKSIIKTGTPVDLKLLNKTSRRAVVTWRGPFNSYYDETPVEYRLVYQLSGVQDLSGSSSQITCDHQAMRYLEKCEGELELPCPGALYEVEVYSKFMSTPRSEAYWSEPARTTFRTDPGSSSDTLDPFCAKEPELINNKYVAVYEIKKFERNFRKEGSALQLKVKSLGRKLDKIYKLCRELSLDNCDDFVL